jgi:hypothetical protein
MIEAFAQCVGRRQLHVSVVERKVLIRITLGPEKALAHLLLESDEADKLRFLLDEAYREVTAPEGTA